MKKAILAIAAAATIAVGTLSMTGTADARCRNCGIGLALRALNLRLGRRGAYRQAGELFLKIRFCHRGLSFCLIGAR